MPKKKKSTAPKKKKESTKSKGEAIQCQRCNGECFIEKNTRGHQITHKDDYKEFRKFITCHQCNTTKECTTKKVYCKEDKKVYNLITHKDGSRHTFRIDI